MLVFAFDDLLEAKQWALDTQKGRRNLDKWELGKIALKLKPELEARAKSNQSAAGGDKTDKGALLVNSPKALPCLFYHRLQRIDLTWPWLRVPA